MRGRWSLSKATSCRGKMRSSELGKVESSVTAEGQRDGTNCDEPRGTRLVGVVKADQGRGDHTTLCSGTKRNKWDERPVGSQASSQDEKTGRRRFFDHL